MENKDDHRRASSLTFTTASSIPLELTKLLGAAVADLGDIADVRMIVELFGDIVGVLTRPCRQASATTRRHNC